MAQPQTPDPQDRRPPIQRLLFVADAAVADVDELPLAVRAVFDAAAEVHVLTPTLPGRLAWLADDVDRYRHIADERLDTVLGHLHSIDVHADGAALRGSVLTVIADAVATFRPDHILLALRSPGTPTGRSDGSSSTSSSASACRSPPTPSTSKGTPRPRTARCCSATTDPMTPSTPSSAQASCSTAATRSS